MKVGDKIVYEVWLVGDKTIPVSKGRFISSDKDLEVGVILQVGVDTVIVKCGEEIREVEKTSIRQEVREEVF